MCEPALTPQAFNVSYLVRPQEAGEAQLDKKYFIAFNSSPAYPPFASYNHVMAKHSWLTRGLLHCSVNRPSELEDMLEDVLKLSLYHSYFGFLYPY